jgi:uncharacterized protein YndB with AHSA1/START domain
MAIIEESVEIKQPASKVFAYVTDMKNLPEWELNAVEAEQTSKGPMGVGATCRGINRAMGQKMPWTSKITEYEPDKRCCEVITSGSTRIDERLTFEPTDIGTRFTQVYDMKIGGFFRLMSPMVVSSMRKQMKMNLANLKRILETQP